MFSEVTKDDLRGRKTKKALYSSMLSVLNRRNFKKITIKEICEKALISRAAFYAHFVDKYDLLKQWVSTLLPENFCDYTYEQMENKVNRHIYENKSVVKNLFYRADDETYNILFNFIAFAINPTMENVGNEIPPPQNTVLASFYAGGVMSYILWQIKNEFPPEVPLMNSKLIEIIRTLKDLDSN